jgi:hypothetical protein
MSLGDFLTDKCEHFVLVLNPHTAVPHKSSLHLPWRGHDFMMKMDNDITWRANLGADRFLVYSTTEVCSPSQILDR